MKKIIAEIENLAGEYKLFINGTLCGKFETLKQAKQQAQYFTGKNNQYGFIRQIIHI